VSRLIVFSISGSSRRLRTSAITHPTSSPSAAPPAAFQTKSQPASSSEKPAPKTAARAML
jgi:hypothetical protein